ncbi:MAG: FHA domain-containing protein [Microterricola sp.]
MVSAVVFTATCGRCGAWSDAGDVHCRHCGSRHAPSADAASAAPLLNGTAVAPPWRHVLSVVIDLLVPVALLASAFLAGTAAAGLLLVFLGLGAAAACLVSNGRSGRWLGGWITRTRTVDSLTATPLGSLALLARIVTRAGRGLSCIDLLNGRDPIRAVFVPLAPRAIAPTERAAPSERPQPPRPPAAVPAAAAAPATPPDGPLTLVLDSGQRVSLNGGLLIGRNPSNAVGSIQHELLALPDLSRTLSKTHALIEWAGGEIWVTDLGSTNGTALLGSADTDAPGEALPAGIRTPVPERWTLALGDRSLSFVKPMRGTQ